MDSRNLTQYLNQNFSGNGIQGQLQTNMASPMIGEDLIAQQDEEGYEYSYNSMRKTDT